MYPLALEQQYGKLFGEEFRHFASDVNAKFLKIAKNYVRENPNNDPRLDSNSNTQLTLTETRLDVSDLLKSMFALRDEYGDFPPRKKFESQITRNFHQIDAWTRDKTNDLVQKQNVVMGNPSRAGVSGGDRANFRVPAVTLPTAETPALWNAVNESVNRNRKIASSAFKTHFSEVQSQIEAGIRNGTSYKDIADQITRTTDVSQSRAEFWARDQAKNFFGEQAKQRQMNAGFPGFIWRTQKDSRVRDSHGVLEGKYFTWDQLPILNRKGIGLLRTKPCDEYGCRCWAEPAWGPKESSQAQSSPNINLGAALKKNESGNILTQKIEFHPHESFAPTVRKSLDSLSSLYQFPKSLPTLQISSMKNTGRNQNSLGYFDPETSSMVLNTSGPLKDTLESTFLHEFGHMMDYRLLGSPGMYGTRSAALDEFRKAVSQTDLFRNLSRGLISGVGVKFGREFPLPDQRFKKNFKYLLSYEELFARAHEMYIARKLGSNEILKQIRTKEAMNFVSHYWDENDFKKVEIIMDKIFNEHGLLK